MRNPQSKRLKSFSLFIPAETVLEQINKLGFIETASATIISDMKFWSRRVFKKGTETVMVSDEIGDANYLRDPVVTICGKKKTIDLMSKLE